MVETTDGGIRPNQGSQGLDGNGEKERGITGIPGGYLCIRIKVVKYNCLRWAIQQLDPWQKHFAKVKFAQDCPEVLPLNTVEGRMGVQRQQRSITHVIWLRL